MRDTEQPQPYSVRLPMLLRRQLEESARVGGRSLHAEILLRLGVSLDASKEEDLTMNANLEDRMHQIARKVAIEVMEESSHGNKKKPS